MKVKDMTLTAVMAALSMILERFVSQSPKELLIAPHWGLKNYEFTNLLVNYLKQHKIFQGSVLSEV